MESTTDAVFEAARQAREADGALASSGNWYDPPRWRHPFWACTHRLPDTMVEAAFNQLVRLYPPEHAMRLFAEDPGSDASKVLRWPVPFHAAQDAGLRLGLDAAHVRLMDRSPQPPLVSSLRSADQFVGARFELAVWAALARAKQRFVHASERDDGGTLDFRWDTADGPIDIEAKTVAEKDNSGNERLAYQIVNVVETEARQAGRLIGVGMEWLVDEIPPSGRPRRRFERALELHLSKLRAEARQAFASDSELDFPASGFFRCVARPFANFCGSYGVLPLSDREEAFRIVRNAVRRVAERQASRERPFAIVLRVPPTVAVEAIQARVAAYAALRNLSPDWFLGCVIERLTSCDGPDFSGVPRLFVPIPPTGVDGRSQLTLQGLADVLNATVLQRHFLLDHTRPSACPWFRRQ